MPRKMFGVHMDSQAGIQKPLVSDCAVNMIT